MAHDASSPCILNLFQNKFWEDLNFYQSDDKSTLFVDINGIKISNQVQMELLKLGTEKNFLFHVDSNKFIVQTGDIDVSCRILNILFGKKDDDQITPDLFYMYLKPNQNQKKILQTQEIKSHLFPSRISSNASLKDTLFIKDENLKQKILQYLKDEMNFSNQDTHIRSISLASID